MPMPDLIRFTCIKHVSIDVHGTRRPTHTADMTWDQYQDYDGDCVWIGVVVVNNHLVV